jgi:hypothetical protein
MGTKGLEQEYIIISLASKPSSTEEETMKSNELSSSLPPSELNISQGLAGTLVEQIVIESNQEAHL